MARARLFIIPFLAFWIVANNCYAICLGGLLHQAKKAQHSCCPGRADSPHKSGNCCAPGIENQVVPKLAPDLGLKTISFVPDFGSSSAIGVLEHEPSANRNSAGVPENANPPNSNLQIVKFEVIPNAPPFPRI